MTNSNNIPYSNISSIKFYVLNSKDIEVESCVEIINPDILQNGKPFQQGVLDANLGAGPNNAWPCSTCHHKTALCPGHDGMIRLKYPVFSPLFISEIVKWLKIICFNCGKIILIDDKVTKKNINMTKILAAYVQQSRNQKYSACINCGTMHPFITKDKSNEVIIMKELDKNSEATILLPKEAADVFNKISNATLKILGKTPECHPRNFILFVLKVPTSVIRPTNLRKNANDSLTITLQSIVKENEKLSENVEINSDIIKSITQLNFLIFSLIKDGGGKANKMKIVTSTGSKTGSSISNRWRTKNGRIRKQLLGRRANHMGRSIITCDIDYKIDEVGVPLIIARNIQLPEVVQHYNINKLYQYFNDPEEYPGCSSIKKITNGEIYDIQLLSDQFKQLEIGDILYRDVVEGDIVNFNRQPTLEPSSISSMKVRIVPHGHAIRMNVLACPLFNADFDGDAMNILFPISTRTSNEIQELSNPMQFFVSYKDGKPKLGEMHDSIIGLSILTESKTLMDKLHAMRLFSNIDMYHDFSQYPSDKLFTGRELVTILLRGTGNFINFNRKASFYHEEHKIYRNYDDDEVNVNITRGKMTKGILDKASIGEGSLGGIFHIVHNKYGAKVALKLVFDLQQLALAHLRNCGLSISMGDILLTESAIDDIHKIEAGIIAESIEISKNLNDGKIIAPIGTTVNDFYEKQQIIALNTNAEDKFWDPILNSIDVENNNLYKIINTGTRGKLSNLKNISCAIGQFEINGERIKDNLDGTRALAYFTNYDMDPAAKGFTTNSYISGLSASEYVFHAQENRYQLINKALSTSITGDQNRMSIKNLEAMVIDNQRKVSNNNKIIQPIYGTDGVDPRYIESVLVPIAEKDLNDEKFKELFYSSANNFNSANKNLQTILDNEFNQLKEDRKYYLQLFLRMERQTTKKYNSRMNSPININRIIDDIRFDQKLSIANFDPVRCIEKVSKLCNNITYCLINEIQEVQQTPIPYYMEKSTTLIKLLIRSYLNTATLNRYGFTNHALDMLIIQIKQIYLRSLISYGKAIGIISAQSISEPMTQVILNSHHNSGVASTKKKGMKRIKEILGAKSTVKMELPSMVLQVLPEFRKDKFKVQEIANQIEMLELGLFLSSHQVFFEEYKDPVHPEYIEEKQMIHEYEKYNPNIKIPSDLVKWCNRIVLNKEKMIEKQITIETIRLKIKEYYPDIHIVYTSNNADNIILRLYFRNSLFKKEITLERILELNVNLMKINIRGYNNIKAAYVEKNSTTVLQEDGSLKTEDIYQIFTAGTNMIDILDNPFIVPETIQSDSIMEVNEILGLEAARNKIISELKEQISGPSPRHFTIYADEMIFNGSVTSIDRYGTGKREGSSMLRMSDNDPVNVIKSSAINGAIDNLQGVSGNIMLGSNPMIGSMYNSFVLDEEFITSQKFNILEMLDDI